jgi:tetratricopeptide (TPR) repeat protein
MCTRYSRQILCLAGVLTFSAFAADPDAESLIRNGHWKRAREAAEAHYRTHPNDARDAYLLARVRRAFESFSQEVTFAEMAVRLDPKTSAYHRELGLAYLHQVENSSMLKAIGLMRRCRTELDAALAIAPNDPDNLFEKMDFLLQAPAVAGGDKKKAVEVANELLKIDPARGYLALARTAWKQKEFGKLEGLYRKATEVSPQSYEAQVALAGLYLGNPVVPDDSSSRSRANLGMAEQHARAALDLNADRIDAYRILVDALVSQKRFDDTGRTLTRSEEAVPDDLSPYVTVARAMLRQGVEFAKAETYLRKYLTQTKEPEPGAPLLAGVHRSLAMLYEKEGRQAEARGELETALRLKPDFEAARRDLKRLK